MCSSHNLIRRGGAPRGPLSETSTARGTGGNQFGARPSGPCLRKSRSPRPRFGDRRCRRRRRRDALEAPAAPPSASCAARAWSRKPCTTVAFHKSEADGPPMLPFQPGRAHAEPSRRGPALGVARGSRMEAEAVRNRSRPRKRRGGTTSSAVSTARRSRTAKGVFGDVAENAPNFADEKKSDPWSRFFSCFPRRSLGRCTPNKFNSFPRRAA